MMRSLPAEYISLCIGINIYGQATFSPRSLRPAIIGFVELLRENHPNVPITLMSPIWALEKETSPNAAGFTIQAIRAEVSAAVDALRARGDLNVHYINGLDILGQEHELRLPDRLHPDAEGYCIMGRNFLAKVVPLFITAREEVCRQSGGS
jgi:lysophospholipase L1-like esterase